MASGASWSGPDDLFGVVCGRGGPGCLMMGSGWSSGGWCWIGVRRCGWSGWLVSTGTGCGPPTVNCRVRAGWCGRPTWGARRRLTSCGWPTSCSGGPWWPRLFARAGCRIRRRGLSPAWTGRTRGWMRPWWPWPKARPASWTWSGWCALTTSTPTRTGPHPMSPTAAETSRSSRTATAAGGSW